MLRASQCTGITLKELLYLSHRIPYPPNKGDKIRSYHLLRWLTKSWKVHLGTFVDDENDWQYTDTLADLCCETKFIGLNPVSARIRALRGFVTGTSLTMPYYRSRELQDWVRSLVEKRDIDCIVAFSSPMAQYTLPVDGRKVRSIVDFCDMDSEKWREYGQKFRGIKRWFYSREARKLAKEEMEFAVNCDASIFVSDDEMTLFRSHAGKTGVNAFTVRNGVDAVYYDPQLRFCDPYRGNRKSIVFVGVMDYWPNIDAATWFAERVFPALKARDADAHFYIVGSNPDQRIQNLGRQAGVTVTGRVDDVRPYLQHARCVVAPLRLARGVQNKVLEAMAMAKPLVATEAALEGISGWSNVGVSICDSEAEWIDRLAAILEDSSWSGIAPCARRHVVEQYSWEASARELASVVNGGGPPPQLAAEVTTR